LRCDDFGVGYENAIRDKGRGIDGIEVDAMGDDDDVLDIDLDVGSGGKSNASIRTDPVF